MIQRTLRGMLFLWVVTAVGLGLVSAPTFAITTPTPQPTQPPVASSTPLPLPTLTYTPSPTALSVTETPFVPTTDPVFISATETVAAFLTAEGTSTALVPTIDPLLSAITETVQAATAVFETQTSEAVHSITPDVTPTPTAADGSPVPNAAITETVAAVTASAATRIAQTPDMPELSPTPVTDPQPVEENAGGGGQTLLVAVLIALGLIVVAFSQATRRR